ncbi:nuclear envelope pore membrane protein POM 121-like [Cylas formicarius]|uniref:nuclear envelope pore membrane protein POM 121-like n=1 Tax=Cylas formicarius TaxID=197179 RepID=UPI002958D07B|nr:nuclear envelope pore membrane protein POM 121-like [Cylas formicarius]
MKILLLVAFVALANADVSHLQHPGYAYQKPAETYGTPLSSYGVPQGSVQGLPSFEGFGSAKSFDQYNQDYLKAFANSPASSQLSFSNIQQPGSFQAPVSAQFGLPSAQQGVSFQSAGFSNPSPSVDVSNFQFSTPAPSVDVSNFQFSTPAPSADLSAFQFSTPAPAVASAGVSGVSVADGQFSTPKPSVNVLQYSQPQSFGFGSGFNSASFPGASASGFAGFGQSVVGKTSGGSIDDAFGASNDAQVGNEEQKTQVSKHLYFFAAPEEPEEEVKPRINLPAQAAQKSYKIIFIKAPTYKSQLPINIPAPPANEEKTLVYVLVKKPDAQATINVQPSQPAKPTKPEVFFIKYKSQKEAEEAVAKLQSQYGVSVSPNFESANALDSASVPAGVGSQAESGFSGFGLEGRNAIISSQPELPSGSFGSLSQSEGQGFVGFGGNSVSAPEIKSFGGVVSNQPEVVGFGGFGSSTPTPVTFGGNSADSLRVFGAGVGGLGQVGLSGGNANLLQAKFGFNVGSTESPAGAGVSVESSSPAAVVSSPAEESAPEEEASTEASSTDDASQNAVDNSEVAVSTLARSGDSGVNYQSEGSNFYQTGFQTYGVPK